MTPPEQTRFLRMFLFPFIVLSALSIYFGITGYLTPIPSFQAYLATLPGGLHSVLNNATYLFLFKEQYLLQAVLCILTTSVGIWAFIYPEKAMQKVEGIFHRLGLDERFQEYHAPG